MHEEGEMCDEKAFFNLITMFMSCLLVIVMFPVQSAPAQAEESRLTQKLRRPRRTACSQQLHGSCL